MALAGKVVEHHGAVDDCNADRRRDDNPNDSPYYDLVFPRIAGEPDTNGSHEISQRRSKYSLLNLISFHMKFKCKIAHQKRSIDIASSAIWRRLSNENHNWLQHDANEIFDERRKKLRPASSIDGGKLWCLSPLSFGQCATSC
jgi:hypothetical protein